MLVSGSLRNVRRNRLVLAVALGAAVVTALVYGIPPLPFAYQLAGAASFTSAATSIAALAVGVLFAIRRQWSGRRTDGLLAILFGVIALLEGVLPVVAEPVHGTADLAFWARIIGRTFVGLGLCVTAWLPERSSPRRRGTVALLVATSLGIAGLVILCTSGLVAHLPGVVDDRTHPGNALAQQSGILTFRLVGTALLLAAAIGFVRKGARLHDRVFDWLASGVVLMAVARFHDFLFPSMHADWLTTGDLFRMVGCWVVIAGAMFEVTKQWRELPSEARRRERRALAAELHDGLAQELAYLTTQSALAEMDPADPERIARIRAGAERALSETRLRIDQYTDRAPVPLDRVLDRLGRDLQDRSSCPIVLDLEPVGVDARTAHELGRVTQEAVANAVRHADARQIAVHLHSDAGLLQLSVVDDGRGLEPSTTGRGFGLMSMRERAERLGGRCSIVSAPHGGTIVAVEIPRR